MTVYVVTNCSPTTSAATGTISQAARSAPRLSNDPPAATAPRSAPRLMVLATSNARIAGPTIQLENLRRRLTPSPTPVWRAMRAQSSCITDIRGKVKSAVHKSPRPNWLPTWLYVPIPLGSSSLAPVISPGPSSCKNPFGPCLLASSSVVLPAEGPPVKGCGSPLTILFRGWSVTSALGVIMSRRGSIRLVSSETSRSGDFRALNLPGQHSAVLYVITLVSHYRIRGSGD